MLKRIQAVPDGIQALAAVGTVTGEDYRQAVEPIIDDARRTGRRIRLLLEVGPEYDGDSADVAREKTATLFRSPSLLRLFDGYAVLTDMGWLRDLSHFTAFLLPFPLRIFGLDRREDAIAWLSSLPEGPGVTHRLDPESGVLVVDVTGPLRAQDFDALAETADAWLATHELLPGVVIHAPEFPGWENAASMLRHLRFVRDHQRRVARVAVAADGALADLAPHVARHLVHAEIKHFGDDELDAATAWAAGSSVPLPARVSSAR
ncbi:MAG: STAS/SEC14 domain-containing protein [Pseudonocardia sp.]|nr:STAS/SEC14 domain-containing protein [Pseudonocardia sp.]